MKVSVKVPSKRKLDSRKILKEKLAFPSFSSEETYALSSYHHITSANRDPLNAHAPSWSVS